MQSYAGGKSAPHEIRGVRQGYHGNEFVWTVNHIPNFLKTNLIGFRSFHFQQTNRALHFLEELISSTT